MPGWPIASQLRLALELGFEQKVQKNKKTFPVLRRWFDRESQINIPRRQADVHSYCKSVMGHGNLILAVFFRIYNDMLKRYRYDCQWITTLVVTQMHPSNLRYCLHSSYIYQRDHCTKCQRYSNSMCISTLVFGSRADCHIKDIEVAVVENGQHPRKTLAVKATLDCFVSNHIWS